MNRDTVAFWTQTIGNLGLLLGLLMVGLQIQQNNLIARATLVAAGHHKAADFYSALLGENPAAIVAKAATSPETLTSEEIAIVLSYAEWRYGHLRHYAILQDLGVVGGGWRVQIPVHGEMLGLLLVAREYILSMNTDADWALELRDVIRDQPKHGGKAWLENYRKIARSYASQ